MLSKCENNMYPDKGCLWCQYNFAVSQKAHHMAPLHSPDAAQCLCDQSGGLLLHHMWWDMNTIAILHIRSPLFLEVST